MEYRRVGEIACCLSPSEGSVIRYHTSVEVSFDCSNCKRTGRTVRFDNVDATGVCTPAQKCIGFPGRLLSVLPFELDGKSFVKYQIQYDYIPFLDLKNGNESTCEPTWGRVSFDITCAKCGSSTTRSTQNNLVRPHSVHCACGVHLYDDAEEMPLLHAHMGDPTYTKCWTEAPDGPFRTLETVLAGARSTLPLPATSSRIEMSLPKRNRRKVEVRGGMYHWSKGSRGDNGRGVATVQHESGTGSKLMIDPYGSILYDAIPSAIEFALDNGWDPNEPGPPFWIGYSTTPLHPACFVLRSPSDPPFWRDANRDGLLRKARDAWYAENCSGSISSASQHLHTERG